MCMSYMCQVCKTHHYRVKYETWQKCQKASKASECILYLQKSMRQFHIYFCPGHLARTCEFNWMCVWNELKSAAAENSKHCLFPSMVICKGQTILNSGSTFHCDLLVIKQWYQSNHKHSNWAVQYALSSFLCIILIKIKFKSHPLAISCEQWVN